MFSPPFQPLCTAQLLRCTCGSLALLHLHMCWHPSTSIHSFTLHGSSLTKTAGAKGSFTPKGRETAPSLPLPGCFSPIIATFLPRFPPLLHPQSPRVLQAGRLAEDLLPPLPSRGVLSWVLCILSCSWLAVLGGRTVRAQLTPARCSPSALM